VGEIGEEAKRAGIGPVCVVDGEQQRALGGEIDRQPVQAIERREGFGGGAVGWTVSEDGCGGARHAGQAS
jgi:hypothetical protein